MLHLHMHIIIGFWVAVSKIFWNFHPAKKWGNDPNLMTIFFNLSGSTTNQLTRFVATTTRYGTNPETACGLDSGALVRGTGCLAIGES